MQTPLLKVGPRDFIPRLVVFDKDGTLIDFNFKWGTWMRKIGEQLDLLLNSTVSTRLFQSFGFDPITDVVNHDSPLAVWSMVALADLAVEKLLSLGFNRDIADRSVRTVWIPPDPVKLARPLADLRRLFSSIHSAGVKAAIATSDDRAASIATIESLGISPFVSAVAAADDDLPTKPAPEILLRLRSGLGIQPEQTVMVGDALADLMMGKSAGVSLVVGMLSGVGSEDVLANFADALVPTVGELV